MMRLPVFFYFFYFSFFLSFNFIIIIHFFVPHEKPLVTLSFFQVLMTRLLSHVSSILPSLNSSSLSASHESCKSKPHPGGRRLN